MPNVLRVASASAVATRAKAVCGGSLLGVFLLAGTVLAEEAVPGNDGTVIGVRVAQAPRQSLRQSPPWEKPTRQIGLDVQPPPGRLPDDSFAELIPAAARAPVAAEPTRGWGPAALHWAPSEIVHQPLYFDDQSLERYGQTFCPVVQPLVSGARFFGTFPVMPYLIGVDRPYDCISTAGYVRAGRCAPPVCERLPLRLDASLLESGAWVGFVFLLP